MTYQDSPNYFWMASYQAIAAANHALEAIAELGAKGVVVPHRKERRC